MNLQKWSDQLCMFFCAAVVVIATKQEDSVCVDAPVEDGCGDLGRRTGPWRLWLSFAAYPVNYDNVGLKLSDQRV